MRLDTFLFENGYTSSRTEAKSFITEGAVTVDGKQIKKPSYEVDCDVEITVDKSSKKYVSRGGTKLEAALLAFNINPQGKAAIDVGASTGGFTDCLLKMGAEAVICVDSGTNQLVASLREDKRITVMENYNARYLTREDIPFVPDLAVMDVSFISATYILPAIYETIEGGGDFICLIKPQFEVGRSNLGKGGIVKSEKARNDALNKVTSFAESCGFTTVKTTPSDIIGGDGNIEYLAHFKK